MSSKYNRNLGLTSTNIPVSYEGTYSFDVFLLLLPNEMLRREFQRGNKAVNILGSCFSYIFNKIHELHLLAFVEWLNDFLIPLLHCHSVIQEKILFLYYAELSVAFDTDEPTLEVSEQETVERQNREGYCESLHHLKGRMLQLQVLTKKMANLICMKEDSQNKDDLEKNKARIKAMVKKMKEEYCELMFQYYCRFNEEEKVWPAIIKTHHKVLCSLSKIFYSFLCNFLVFLENGCYRYWKDDCLLLFIW
jgi:hypothetical protein